MPPVSLLIKPSSSLCNMRCKYCFYSDVSDIRDIKSYGMMSKETADRLITKALAFADSSPVCFAFQGGEPTLSGIDFFKHFVKTVNEKNKKGSKIFYGMQTNGLLIDEKWANFFHDNNFLVGLSLDGNEKFNSFRVDKDEKSTFDRVLKSAQILKDNKVEFNILSVLTGRSAENITEIYSFFKNQGFKYLQFIPCLRPFGDKSENEKYMTVKQYEYFLNTLFKLYAEDYISGNYISIRQFDNWVQMFRGNKPEQCGMLGHCTFQFVAEGNGNIYPCDFYCIDEWLLGNINDDECTFEDMIKSEKMMSFIKESMVVDEKCKRCRYYPLCRCEGCKRNRADRSYCEAYKSFFENNLPLFRAFI